MDRWNDELYHHGVLGMRWGHRKQEPRSGNRNKNQFRYRIRNSVYTPTERTVKEARKTGGLIGGYFGSMGGAIAGVPIGAAIADRAGLDGNTGGLVGALLGSVGGIAIGALIGRSNKVTRNSIDTTLNSTLRQNMTYGDNSGNAYGFDRKKISTRR